MCKLEEHFNEGDGGLLVDIPHEKKQKKKKKKKLKSARNVLKQKKSASSTSKIWRFATESELLEDPSKEK
jgi:hypothetical protein